MQSLAFLWFDMQMTQQYLREQTFGPIPSSQRVAVETDTDHDRTVQHGLDLFAIVHPHRLDSSATATK
jgi:hypothetical protein